MIERFITLKNIGKFRDHKAVGDATLRRLTLVFAPNGRGKTTLCDVLRSLQAGRPEYVKGRQTLGGAGDAEAVVRANGLNYTLKNGAWSGTLPDVAIFDSTFIHENVYAGDYVDRDHKRALHNVIVGNQGVVLARDVATLDARIKQETKRIGELESQLQRHVPAGMDLKAFVALSEVADFDRKIAEAEGEVEASARASELIAKPKLVNVALPVLPDGFEALLGRELGELSKDAEKRVREHLRDHTKGGTERWLAEGLDSVKGGECPFCQQRLDATDIVGAYRAFFGESYKALKSDIATMATMLAACLGEDVLLGIQRDVAANSALVDFWRQFVTLEPAQLDFAQVRQALLTLRAPAQRALAAKQQVPLEPIALDGDLQTAIEGLSSVCKSIVVYNVAIDTANASIERRKAEVQTTDLAATKKKLVVLKATKTRTSPEVAQACDDYLNAMKAKKALESEKKAAKEKLDQYTAQVFLKYQSQINAILEQFGADFRITNTTQSYLGGKASSDYQLVINSVPVGLGGPDAPLDATSFRNTLSAGDRSTLALAFFLAQLDLDPDLGQKIVVLDDPFTSQDRSRRTCTQQLLRRKSTMAGQVIVFSHDADFLKLIWEGYDAANVKTLQLARTGQDTVIREWNIQAETRPAYFDDQAKLKESADAGQGDRRAVVRCIRPVLEGYMRLRAYPDFKQSEWLGDLIKNIREAAAATPLAGFQPMLAELEDINDYSKRYHHQDNPIGDDSEPPDDGELLTYVKRALAFVAS